MDMLSNREFPSPNRSSAPSQNVPLTSRHDAAPVPHVANRNYTSLSPWSPWSNRSCYRRGTRVGTPRTHLPTSLFILPFLSFTKSILLITHTMLTPRANMQLMALITPAKNLLLSCMNWLSMRYVEATLKFRFVDRWAAKRGKSGIWE